MWNRLFSAIAVSLEPSPAPSTSLSRIPRGPDGGRERVVRPAPGVPQRTVAAADSSPEVSPARPSTFSSPSRNAGLEQLPRLCRRHVAERQCHVHERAGGVLLNPSELGPLLAQLRFQVIPQRVLRADLRREGAVPVQDALLGAGSTPDERDRISLLEEEKRQ